MIEEQKVLVYIDNSNIFINAQEYSAKKKRFLRTVRDKNIRIDMGKMVRVACKGRMFMRGRLYGSEPPRLDTLWNAIREKQIEVYPSERSTWNQREKKTDTGFVCAATEDLICMKRNGGDDRAIILFTGDLDMMPLVHMALKHNWKVEIWSFRSALSNDLKNESKDSNVKIFMLDEHFEMITYPSVYFSGNNVPAERSFVIRLDSCLDHEELRKAKLVEIIDKTSRLFQLPFKGSFISNSDPSELILIPSIREEVELKSGKIDKIYDFNSHIWRRIRELKDLLNFENIITFLDYLSIKNGYEIEPRNISDVEDNEIEEYNAETAAGEFVTIRRKFERTKQLYSKLCSYDYRCRMGLNCPYDHRVTEKEFFKEHPTFKRYNYKSIMCNRGNTCSYVLEKASHKCGFAHSLLEARCLRCHKVGIHWTNECSLNTV